MEEAAVVPTPLQLLLHGVQQPLLTACLALYALFFAALLAHVLPAPSMFARRHARPHRLLGALHLAVLALGLADAAVRCSSSSGMPGHAAGSPSAAAPGLVPPLPYDIALSLSGLALTLTAAWGFSSHRHVRNPPGSGALDAAAMITVDEMLEHAFYQGLNLAQALYLHVLPALGALRPGLGARLGLLAGVTLPWAFRSRFPVNSFSANYGDGRPATLIAVLYRLKKYQYLLYKHCLLHGLNITAALRPPGTSSPGPPLASSPSFRLYWLSLNAAYVLEFFLQTLVKKGRMRQPAMLALNQLLMLAATAPALLVLLAHVRLPLAALSLLLNLGNRGHELANVAVTTLAGMAVQAYLG